MNNYELNKSDVVKFIKDSLKNDSGKPNKILFLNQHIKYEYKSIESIKEKWRFIFGAILKNVLGKKWYKNPLKSVSIIEHGKVGKLHIHCLLNIGDITDDDFRNALDKTIENRSVNLTYDFVDSKTDVKNYKNRNHLLVESVYDLNGVIDYILKEYWFGKDKINFDNLYTSEMLFTL